MAGKSNTSATFFAQKKLFGKAHTSNLKTDGEELIGSNIQTSLSLVFGEGIPTSPSRTLYLLQSASAGMDATVEYIQFAVTAITGTTYDANDTGGGSGSDSGESSQSSGVHAYKLVMPSTYVASSSNSKKGEGVFNNNKIVHETLGALQLVPPFYSQTAPNPYIVKIYKDDGSGGVGDEIPLLDNIDWSIDYYNGILFVQDYNADKIPAYARAFAYIGKMADEVTGSSSSSGGGGDGDASASYLTLAATGSLSNERVLTIGTGLSGSDAGAGGAFTITLDADPSTTRDRDVYTMTGSLSAGTTFYLGNTDFSEGGHHPSYIDVHINGQLVHSGTSVQVAASDADYTIVNDSAIKFSYALEEDDIIDVTTTLSGANALTPNPASSNLIVHSAEATLPNSRVLSAGTGISIDTSTSGIISISSPASQSRHKSVYTVTASHAADNILEIGSSVDFSSGSHNLQYIDVYLNGTLMTSGSTDDYVLTSDTSVKFKFALEINDVVQSFVLHE